MKKTTIQHYTAPDHSSIYIKRQKYKLALGRDYVYYFSNKKELQRCMNYVNQHLTIVSDSLRSIDIEILQVFNWLFAYLDTKEIEHITENYKRNCWTINRANMAFKSPNQSYMTIRQLDRVTQTQLESIGILLDNCTDAQQWIARRQLSSIKKQIQNTAAGFTNGLDHDLQQRFAIFNG